MKLKINEDKNDVTISIFIFMNSALQVHYYFPQKQFIVIYFLLKMKYENLLTENMMTKNYQIEKIIKQILCFLYFIKLQIID